MKPLLAAFLLCLLMASANAADKLTVYTVNYPLQYFAQRIAADHAEVIFPAPPEVDPAFWKPDTEIIRAYQKADLVLLNGAGYAGWVEKASLPRLRQVNTSAAFKEGYISVQEGLTHSHGPAGDHSHAGTAFTTWLDLYQAVQQAESIMQALVKKRPGYKAVFEQNFNALRDDLMALDLKIQKLVASKAEQPMLASHPVYQYLARRYLLHIEDVQWEPDVVPGAAEWQRLRYTTEHFPAQWMIWEKQPVAETGRRLDSMSIGTLVFDPCANRPRQGDFLGVMQQNVRNLSKAYALPEQG
ncbi:MAG: metal ABC transporter substrate-binding protein [Thiogranum sp.]